VASTANRSRVVFMAIGDQRRTTGASSLASAPRKFAAHSSSADWSIKGRWEFEVGWLAATPLAATGGSRHS
jgi:hypothetical protein